MKSLCQRNSHSSGYFSVHIQLLQLKSIKNSIITAKTQRFMSSYKPGVFGINSFTQVHPFAIDFSVLTKLTQKSCKRIYEVPLNVLSSLSTKVLWKDSQVSTRFSLRVSLLKGKEQNYLCLKMYLRNDCVKKCQNTSSILESNGNSLGSNEVIVFVSLGIRLGKFF